MKSVLISGAGRGIGRALCAEALARGYRVHALVRKREDAPPGTIAHVADIREREKVGAIIRGLASELTMYLANAGVDAPFHPRDEQAAEKAAQVFEINGTATAYSVYLLAQLWATAAVAGPAAAGTRAPSRCHTMSKRIAIVSSQAAGRGLPRAGAYVATKLAQLALCQALEPALAPYGIGVTVIQPGFIDTEMSAKQSVRPFIWSTARAARVIFNGLERGKFKIKFPLGISLLTGFLNSIPYFIFRPLVRALHRRGAV